MSCFDIDADVDDEKMPILVCISEYLVGTRVIVMMMLMVMVILFMSMVLLIFLFMLRLC